jgi:hypothetical protein
MATAKVLHVISVGSEWLANGVLAHLVTVLPVLLKQTYLIGGGLVGCSCRLPQLIEAGNRRACEGNGKNRAILNDDQFSV